MIALKRSITIFVTLLFALPFVVGQSHSESPRLRPEVVLTTDGVKLAKLHAKADSAERLFRAALELDSTYAPAHYALMGLLRDRVGESQGGQWGQGGHSGEGRSREGRMEQAVAHAKKAYEQDTTNHWYLEGYAESVVAAGGYGESAELYTKLLELDSRNLNAYRTLSIIYQQQGDIERAVALLDSAEVKAGRNPYLAKLKQMMLLQSGRTEVAIAEAEKVVAESPYDTSEWLNLASLYATAGRDSMAHSIYERAYAIDSTNFETLLSYGSYLEDRGRGKRYFEMVARMVALPEEEVSKSAKLELVTDAMGDRAVYGSYREIVEGMVEQLYADYPEDAKVMQLYIQKLLYANEIEAAIGLLKSLLVVESSLEEEDIEQRELQYAYLMTIVDLEGHRRQVDSVLHYVRRAVDLRPQDIELRSEYSRLLAATGRFGGAVEELEKARKVAQSDSLKSVLWMTEGDYRSYLLKSPEIEIVEGRREIERGGYKAVFKAYEKALKHDEANVALKNNYAYTLLVNGSKSRKTIAKALRMAQGVIEVEPNNATYIDTYGWALYAAGRNEEARDELRRALAFDKEDNYEIALHYAEVLAVLRDSAMAEFYYKRAAEWGATQGEIEESRRRVEAVADEGGIRDFRDIDEE